MSKITDVLDIDAGFMDDELLGIQTRLLAGLVAGDPASARQRVPAGWQGYEDALVLRMNQLIAEMQLRGQAAPEPLPLSRESILWPFQGLLNLDAQLALLAERLQQGRSGRIRLPRNDHELWASYKYSLLARNQGAYQSFGQRIASRSIPLAELWQALLYASRTPPTVGGVRNALQHMWGYVSAHSRFNPQSGELGGLLAEVQQQARAHRVPYLLNSTALGELGVWVRTLAA